MRVEMTRDAAAFLAGAHEHLLGDPLVGTVLLTAAGSESRRAAREPAAPVPDHVRWFATVRDTHEQVVGAAMRTAPFAPHPVYVTPMPHEAAVALADALGDRGERPGGVNGSLPAARLVAERCAQRLGEVVVETEHHRLHELGELTMPAAPPGRLRLAHDGDLELCLAWFHAFLADADAQAGRPVVSAGDHVSPDVVRERIAERRTWLWQAPDGQPLHLTGASLPEAGVVRIAPVFTPPEHRGRGLAGRAVAEVAALLRERGSRVCLFTDQANPTSNALYARLGFVPGVDTAIHLVVPDPAEAGPERSGS